LDATTAGMRLELMDGQQGFGIHIGIDAAAAATLAAGGDLSLIKQVIELCGPVDDKGLTERHVSPLLGIAGLKGSLVCRFHAPPRGSLHVSKGEIGPGRRKAGILPFISPDLPLAIRN
jgi:hypothetical protein